MEKEMLQDFARSIILAECAAIEQLSNYIDDEFAEVTQRIFFSKGRLIITGIGKSAIIANKIVATLNSTGTPAIFLHAADAIHGDLGLVLQDDIVLCISKSGNTPEIKVLIPLIKNMGNKVVAMVGNTDSFLAQQSDWVLNTTVKEEACPNNLAPTSSTTAQLVMGDALAMTLLKMRGFTAADFAKFHPGGALGKKLYTRVCDIMSNEQPPLVSPDDHLDKIIIEISTKRLGATAVVEQGQICGVITDGDLRRMLMRGRELLRVTAKDIMSENPKTISADELAINAFNLMERNKITQLLVVEDGQYRGVIHIHDILREGVV
ncbi:Arabinose 5-phosphate isomerase [Mucinivorans hirudinis]|uniref:Arabinose 5-phosphate isomerase n=1 Tax=Mucinivorans hirudinis TaxID=1433126 RepID=A0A060RDA5_9BACT|nr:Arabinose 5-phosphate isomerase [Mucinivorans hirudinis]